MSYTLELITKFTAPNHWIVVRNEDRVSSDIPFLNNQFIPCQVPADMNIDISTAFLRLPNLPLASMGMWGKVQDMSINHKILPLMTGLSYNGGLTELTITWVHCTRDVSNYNPPADDLSDACGALNQEHLVNEEIQLMLHSFFIVMTPQGGKVHETMSIELSSEPSWRRHSLWSTQG